MKELFIFAVIHVHFISNLIVIPITYRSQLVLSYWWIRQKKCLLFLANKHCSISVSISHFFLCLKTLISSESIPPETKKFTSRKYNGSNIFKKFYTFCNTILQIVPAYSKTYPLMFTKVVGNEVKNILKFISIFLQFWNSAFLACFMVCLTYCAEQIEIMGKMFKWLSKKIFDNIIGLFEPENRKTSNKNWKCWTHIVCNFNSWRGER